MKAIGLFRSAFAALLLATLALSSRTIAEEEILSPMDVGDGSNCKAVHAVQEKRVIVDCPAGQVYDFCFTRKMADRAGVITGQLEYFSDPTKEMKLQHAPDQLQYGGVINIVTQSGVLRMEENGIVDFKSKHWAGLSTVSGGTGDFEGATGKLASFGRIDAAGMVNGTICR